MAAAELSQSVDEEVDRRGHDDLEAARLQDLYQRAAEIVDVPSGIYRDDDQRNACYAFGVG